MLQPPPLDEELPKPILNPKFESAITSDCIKMSHSGIDRLVHSHGKRACILQYSFAFHCDLQYNIVISCMALQVTRAVSCFL